MEKKQFIPLEKMSRKAQREYHQAKRGSWGGLNPVTRRPPNPRAYDRKKTRREERFSGAGPFLSPL